jgi:hypothetical protein
MIGETVVRIRAGDSPGDDRYGNPLPGVDADTPLTGAAFDPGGSLEPSEVGREQRVTNPKVYFRDYAPDIVATDRLRVRGDVYRVIGRPAKWVSPYTTQTAGLVVELELAEG